MPPLLPLLLLPACRPAPPPAAPAIPLVGYAPGDDRPQRMAERLALAARRPEARLSSGTLRRAQALAGLAARPVATLERLSAPGVQGTGSQGFGLGRVDRQFMDGTVLRFEVRAPTALRLDDLPAVLARGEEVWIRTSAATPVRLSLSGPIPAGDPLAPDSPGALRVESLQIPPGHRQLVGGWQEPGEYRVEIVQDERVEFLFSLFVDAPIPPVGDLPMPAPPDPPAQVEAGIRALVAQIRQALRLPALRPFPPIRPFLADQAACLDRHDTLAHATPACPSVADRSHDRLFPHPRHWEIAASGESAAEIADLLWHSPAHLEALACTDCAAAEVHVRAADGEGLIVLIEILGFPLGESEIVPQR